MTEVWTRRDCKGKTDGSHTGIVLDELEITQKERERETFDSPIIQSNISPQNSVLEGNMEAVVCLLTMQCAFAYAT